MEIIQKGYDKVYLLNSVCNSTDQIRPNMTNSKVLPKSKMFQWYGRITKLTVSVLDEKF